MPPAGLVFAVPVKFVPAESDIFCGFAVGNATELLFQVRIILAIRASR
jgi:hypothetical protein